MKVQETQQDLSQSDLNVACDLELVSKDLTKQNFLRHGLRIWMAWPAVLRPRTERNPDLLHPW